jgi:hypothetical protein
VCVESLQVYVSPAAAAIVGKRRMRAAVIRAAMRRKRRLLQIEAIKNTMDYDNKN